MSARLAALLLAAATALAVGPVAATAAEPSGYEAGVAARLNGHPAEARTLLEAWLAAHPDDVDAELQLAYANLALGRLDAAQAGFEAVLRTAPDYADARTGIEQVRARRAAHARDSRATISVEGALSDLSGGASNWSEEALDIEAPVGTATIGGRMTHYRRFGLNDTEVEARAGIHPSDDLWLRFHAGTTPNADFRPRFEIGGGIDARLAGSRNTVFSLEGTYQRFPLQDVVTVTPGVTRYFDRGRTWLTLRGIGTVAGGGPLEVGGLARIDHVVDRWRVFAGVANGPDTDLGIVTRTSALFGGVDVPLGQRISATGSISHEWRDVGSDRTEFRLALRAKL